MGGFEPNRKTDVFVSAQELKSSKNSNLAFSVKGQYTLGAPPLGRFPIHWGEQDSWLLMPVVLSRLLRCKHEEYGRQLMVR